MATERLKELHAIRDKMVIRRDKVSGGRDGRFWRVSVCVFVCAFVCAFVCVLDIFLFVTCPLVDRSKDV